VLASELCALTSAPGQAGRRVQRNIDRTTGKLLSVLPSSPPLVKVLQRHKLFKVRPKFDLEVTVAQALS